MVERQPGFTPFPCREEPVLSATKEGQGVRFDTHTYVDKQSIVKDQPRSSSPLRGLFQKSPVPDGFP